MILIPILQGCSADIEQYNEIDKPFDIKRYFNGPVIAWGIVEDFSGKVTRRFCVEIQGNWQGVNGVLAEKFYFDDGEVSYRNWQLIKHSDGTYRGTAEDVVDGAVGQHAGFAFHWQYSLQVPVGDNTYLFNLDDWMYQLDSQRVINKTKMKKFGVTVANISLFFDKSLPKQRCFDQNSTD